jgi:hypothetical protein
VKEIFANQPGRPKPIINAPPPQPIPVGAAATSPAPPTETAVEPSKVEEPVSIGSGVPASGENGVGTVERAAVGLAKAGLAFLQSIAAELESRSAHTAGPQGQGALSSLFSRHPQTNHPMLSIPLPESFTAERMTQAVAQFLSALEVPAK